MVWFLGTLVLICLGNMLATKNRKAKINHVNEINNRAISNPT